MGNGLMSESRAPGLSSRDARGAWRGGLTRGDVVGRGQERGMGPDVLRLSGRVEKWV